MTYLIRHNYSGDTYSYIIREAAFTNEPEKMVYLEDSRTHSIFNTTIAFMTHFCIDDFLLSLEEDADQDINLLVAQSIQITEENHTLILCPKNKQFCAATSRNYMIDDYLKQFIKPIIHHNIDIKNEIFYDVFEQIWDYLRISWK